MAIRWCSCALFTTADLPPRWYSACPLFARANLCYSALCSAPHKADYVDCSIMWTIRSGMFRTPYVAWLFGD